MRRSVPLVLLSITVSIVAALLALFGTRLVREAGSRSEAASQSEVPA